MRRRAAPALLTTVLAVALGACSSTPPPTVDLPVSEIAAESPWPEGGMPGFYMVSEEITEYCPNGEEYLTGTEISDLIPPEAVDLLDGFACVFTAPESGASDEVDEIAYRVDSGLGDLVRAYAATANYVDDECPDPITEVYPHVRIEVDEVGYTVLAGGCRYSPALDEALSALRVTEVARDTVTFAEYEESGL
jgi:hypothetical protein